MNCAGEMCAGSQQCETGVMPPFGNRFGLDVFADDSLEKDKEIAFNAGTHRELIRMA